MFVLNFFDHFFDHPDWFMGRFQWWRKLRRGKWERTLVATQEPIDGKARVNYRWLSVDDWSLTDDQLEQAGLSTTAIEREDWSGIARITLVKGEPGAYWLFGTGKARKLRLVDSNNPDRVVK